MKREQVPGLRIIGKNFGVKKRRSPRFQELSDLWEIARGIPLQTLSTPLYTSFWIPKQNSVEQSVIE